MDIAGFLSETGRRIRNDGIGGVQFGLYRIYMKWFHLLNTVLDTGDYIYDEDWDLLIVLDACRYDLIQDVTDNYDFLSKPESRRSVNSVTKLWMEENFQTEYRGEITDTCYISGNPFTRDRINHSMFKDVVEVWKRAWVEPGTVPPRAVTDATIRAGRDSNCERVIAHYMQPHCPFIPAREICQTKDLGKFGEQGDVWDRLQRGEVSKEAVWEGYRENLELVLDDLRVLLENIDANRVVITSDHGNALGEWKVYGHVPNNPIEPLRKVPWITASATDSYEYEPGNVRESIGVDREEQLESLGYL